ncbi:MAG: glycine--tRNA ligase, partial [Candidatus Altiarchaeota archaeon]|nr:glycine--tRNA ligase [Candidatus Altiarchaeota archaeon]
WNWFVKANQNIVGMDGSVITHPRVWEASGHITAFNDPLVECKACKNRFRADHLLEDKLKINTDRFELAELKKRLNLAKVNCPRCGGELIEPRNFNLMFKTDVGAVQGETSYLRPETAQLIFADFSRIFKTNRASLPFGIAQIGLAFRNEISPRNLVFRAREFEQMELEFFFNPKEPTELGEFGKTKMRVWTKQAQEDEQELVEMTASELVEKKLTDSWHAYWLAQSWSFLIKLGLKPENLRLRQHLDKELSHYAKDTWDIDFHYPFGWKELVGVANRTDFDLKQHAKLSGKDLSIALPDGKKLYPYVLEPSFGVDRLVLALICNSWKRDSERQIMQLSPKIAPVQLGIFPLVNKDGMPKKARDLYEKLKSKFRCYYDEKGSIGRRYRRQDSIGTPVCITIDGQTNEDKTVTLRERDSMNQTRVKLAEIEKSLEKHLFTQVNF